MYLKKRILRAIALVLALILMAGCGLQSEGSDPSDQEAEGGKLPARIAKDGERLYSIPLGSAVFPDKYWVLDRDGNEVIPNEGAFPDYEEIDLIDLATGEARYRVRMRKEIIRNEDGSPRTYWIRSLYDLEGNQLIDWEKKIYDRAFGEYIIRQDTNDEMLVANDLSADYRTALYHVPSGRESYEGAYSAGKLKGDAFLLCDVFGTPLGVVKTAGEVVSGFPPPKTYYNAYTWNGYFTANSKNPYEPAKENPYEQTKENRGVEYLLDSNFRELKSFEWVSSFYGNLRGDYFAYKEGERWGIYHPEDGVVFTSDGASIEYYDGELAIVQTGDHHSEEEISASLVTKDHKVLAGGFSWLTPMHRYDEKGPADRFTGILDEKAVLIDRAGNTLASSVELPGAQVLNVLCDGLYTYHEKIEGFYGEGLLGADLELLVPADRYTSIGLVYGFMAGNTEWDGSAKSALLRADKNIGDINIIGHSIYRMDILDYTGRVIVDNVTGVFDVGPDRIALRRGFDVGLMDLNGNWIAKRSIFHGLGDD